MHPAGSAGHFEAFRTSLVSCMRALLVFFSFRAVCGGLPAVRQQDKNQMPGVFVRSKPPMSRQKRRLAEPCAQEPCCDTHFGGGHGFDACRVRRSRRCSGHGCPPQLDHPQIFLEEPSPPFTAAKRTGGRWRGACCQGGALGACSYACLSPLAKQLVQCQPQLPSGLAQVSAAAVRGQ